MHLIAHLCSYYGDIELVPVKGDQARTMVRFIALTEAERTAVNHVLRMYGRRSICVGSVEGSVIVDQPIGVLMPAIGAALHAGRACITAVRFASGQTVVTDGDPAKVLPVVPAADVDHDDAGPVAPAPEAPVVAVQVEKPLRGCPMPATVPLREQRAADVVRAFLSPSQTVDFDATRAFRTIGGDTGRLYRVTSRWSPDVGRFGVLYDVDWDRSICASQTRVPPSEEMLAMKFAVEHFETAFLRGDAHRHA